MAELWTLTLDEISAEEEVRWLTEMDAAARARFAEIRHPLRRRQRLAGDHLARMAVAQLTGRPLEQVELLHLPSGKPWAEGCCFSVSHSESFVVCAAGPRPVGVDAERLRPFDRKIPNRFFSSAEQAALAAVPAAEQERCFWRIWTGKEALVKLEGTGLSAFRHADTCAVKDGISLSWTEEKGGLIAVAEQIG